MLVARIGEMRSSVPDLLGSWRTLTSAGKDSTNTGIHGLEIGVGAKLLPDEDVSGSLAYQLRGGGEFQTLL